VIVPKTISPVMLSTAAKFMLPGGAITATGLARLKPQRVYQPARHLSPSTWCIKAHLSPLSPADQLTAAEANNASVCWYRAPARGQAADLGMEATVEPWVGWQVCLVLHVLSCQRTEPLQQMWCLIHVKQQMVGEVSVLIRMRLRPCIVQTVSHRSEALPFEGSAARPRWRPSYQA